MRIVFFCICWLGSAYFFVMLHMVAGLPPKHILDDGVFVYVLLFAFFLLLPFAQTLEIGTFFKYSAKINELKSEVKDFKEETRSLIALQNSLITNVSQSVNHNVLVTVPSLAQGRAAEEQLATLEQDIAPDGHTAQDQATAIAAYVDSAGGSVDFALMRLRRELEMELRRVLDKELPFRKHSPTADRPRLLSLRSMWNMFIERYPHENNLEKAFIYTVDVCNAAVHGQNVPREVAEEALSLGFRVLDLLRNIEA
ncbi:hypothetical protein [Stappia sp.]|uniref:hypothetical protein n=1 Tax=Stappia sp. TaxID=1870903 RepID=UPI003A99AF8C